MQELKNLNLIVSDNDSYDVEQMYRITEADKLSGGWIVEKGKKKKVMFSGYGMMPSFLDRNEKIYCLHFRKDTFNGKNMVCETTIYQMNEDSPTVVKIETADEITTNDKIDKISKGNPEVKKELLNELFKYGTINGKEPRTTYKYKTIWEHKQGGK
tara:strand:+ start:7183 stop:7650 length:468 start_codon:yes stop_codon:yes gene_type:complete